MLRDPRNLFRTLLLVTFAGGATSSAAVGPPAGGASSARAKVRFERHEIVTGPAIRQTVLTGFLLGGARADLAVCHVDESGDRRLRVFSFGDDTWRAGLEARLGRDVQFVDVITIAGRDLLIAYQPGRLGWFDLDAGAHRTLLSVDCAFRPPRQGEVPHVDVTHDVNDDGRDDVVVPGVGGFQVFVQKGDGTFADPVKVGRTSDLQRILGADGYRYDPWDQSRVHEIDHDHDGRVDLVFWNGDHFAVHLQDDQGRFTPEPGRFTTDVRFDSDDLSALERGRMTGRVLHSLADVNGDGVSDLVIASLLGRRPSKKRSTLEVHPGTPSTNGTTFASEAGVVFSSADRVQIGFRRYERETGGPAALMLTSIETRFLEGSLWKRIKGAMGDDVWLDLAFHPADAGIRPDEHGAVRRIALDGAPSHREPGWVPLDVVLRGPTHERRRTQKVWPRAFNRTLLIGDVSGDGRADLLIEPEFRNLDVYLGVPGPALFARRPARVDVMLHDAEYAWLADLDGDLRQDLLVHHPFTERDPHGAPRWPPGSEPVRVTVLMSR